MTLVLLGTAMGLLKPHLLVPPYKADADPLKSCLLYTSDAADE